MFYIADMLFGVQHQLSHPNPFSPSKKFDFDAYETDRKTYDKLIQDTVAKYKPERFCTLAMQAFDLSPTEGMCLDDKSKDAFSPRPA
ncbi:expressed unknown protein [Seminavis robusta]|uniref:Uncharacterized protein n=1 Tax=Seminavis robusta TaxID=568900 RepID=A0A9N8EJ34_9STRA|nr:expressed unknown protein [Seminavis robusta]|eukprot:Sro1259_g256930.1 n/a (87) ;mRNA; r:15916-16176